MALRFTQVDEIENLLLQVPDLIDGLERRNGGFTDRVLVWLKNAEEALERDRIPEVSHVAVLRSQLIEASRGMGGADVRLKGRPTARKLRDATAVNALNKCNQVLHDVISERRGVFQEAERITRQLITVAEAKGMVGSCEPGVSRSAYLHNLQERLAADANLASPYLHLASLVGKHDLPIFLDRALPEAAAAQGAGTR